MSYSSKHKIGQALDRMSLLLYVESSVKEALNKKKKETAKTREIK